MVFIAYYLRNFASFINTFCKFNYILLILKKVQYKSEVQKTSLFRFFNRQTSMKHRINNP